MRKITKEEKLDYARRYQEARLNGVSISTFCEENEICSSMLSRYRKELVDQKDTSPKITQPFVRVPVSDGHRPVGEGSAVAVELKGVSIKLGPGYSARQLEHILALVGVSHAV